MFSSSGLDDPHRRLQLLVEKSNVANIALPSSFKSALGSAQTLLNAGDESRIKGDMENAFVSYLKASSFIMERIPTHKEFEKNRNDKTLKELKKKLTSTMHVTEQIRELLLAKYGAQHQVDEQALAAAAGPKPSPPPRPSKPEFLRQNGQPPSGAPMTNSGPLGSSSTVTMTISQPPTPSMIPLVATKPPSNLPYSAPLPLSNGYMNNNLGNNLGNNATSYSSSPIPSSSPSLTPFNNYPNGRSSQDFSSRPTMPTSLAISNPNSPNASPHPVAAPRPLYTLNSNLPVPVPSTLTTVDVSGSKEEFNEGSPPTSIPKPLAPPEPYKYPLSIKPQRLLDYMRQANPPKLLLIDVRMRVLYTNAKINYDSIINIEPVSLRDGVYAKTIQEQSLVMSSPKEQDLFAKRSTFALVIYYDQNTLDVQRSGPLANLVRALYDLEYEKLPKKPVLLEGGFDAWLDCAGMEWVAGDGVENAKQITLGPAGVMPGSMNGTTTSQNHSFISKMAQGGGINRHDGLLIKRTVHDFIAGGEGPQSMINPRLGPNDSASKAYPPRATPHSNVNSKPFPSPHSSQSGGTQGSTISRPTAVMDANFYSPNNNSAPMSQEEQAARLERRKTQISNHWQGFGTEGYGHSQQGSQSGTIGNNDNRLQYIVPTPPRPLRPLPQPPLPQAPAMNDVRMRNYALFESGASKLTISMGKKGIKNLGNTCYMASVIQCLVATPPLARYFLDGTYRREINRTNPLGRGGRTAEAFARLLKSIWDADSDSITPSEFRAYVKDIEPAYRNDHQHDSHEFALRLLDWLNEDLNRGDNKYIEYGKQDEDYLATLSDAKESEIAWSRHLKYKHSHVADLFEGQYCSKITCDTCGKVSRKFDPTWCHSLALPWGDVRVPISLKACLDKFSQREKMEFNCSQCHKKSASKKIMFSRAPKVLILQFKRSGIDPQTKFMGKNDRRVDYPLSGLNLTDYCLPHPEPLLYDAYAVSDHFGHAINAGHYTATTKEINSGEWKVFDDTRVASCDENKAASKAAYMVFYVRRELHGV